MGIARLALGATAAVAGSALLFPAEAPAGYSTIGGALGIGQRDLRVFDNFSAPEANDNTTADPSFPGYTGAELAIWKAAVEWGSELHGDGQGDPHQPGGLGSGGANFDLSWQGNATGTGSINQNIHSQVSGSNGGVLAYCETPISDGWRIRYYSAWVWDDGPDAPPFGRMDLQGVATHELGHALGLGHSTTVGATMYATVSGNGVTQRSIEADDAAGLQSIYGVKSPTKPRITQSSVNTVAGTVTLTGQSFAATGNQVWFTRAASSSPSVDPIVRVSGVASGAGGTSITVAIPAAAGPGDVLVRVPGSGHAALSNAWPLDPGSSGSPYGAPTITGVAPQHVPVVAPGANPITVTGSGFLGLLEVRVGGAPVDLARVTIAADDTLTVDLPPLPALGASEVVVTGAFGASTPAGFTVVAPHPPALRLADPIVLSATGMQLTLGGRPGTLWVLAGSTLNTPTTIPGILEADIGGQMASLVVIGSGTLPASGWSSVDIGVAGLPFGTPLFVQAATIDGAAPALPYVMSNVAGGTFYY
ncbi:MAG: matrixin family metalloprotease [Planctomycetota bacterium]